MTRRRGGIGVSRHSLIVLAPRWLAILLVTVIAYLMSPATSALGASDGLHKQPPGYSKTSDSKGGPDDDTDSNGAYRRTELPWGTGDMAPMYLSYLKNHPEIRTSRRNVAVVQIDPTKEDPHTYHVVTATVNNTDLSNGNLLWIDFWKDGKFEASVPDDLGKDGLLRTDTPRALLPKGFPKSRPTGAFDPVNKHSEQILAKVVDIMGARERATHMQSSFDACINNSNSCREKINNGNPEKSFFPNLKKFYFYNRYSGDRSGASKKEDRESVLAEERERKRWLEAGMPIDLKGAEERYAQPSQARPKRPEAATLFEPPGGVAASGPLVDPSLPSASSPGGIDFSSLELRYMADPGPGANQGLKYAFTASPAIKDNRTEIGLSAAQQASDAFFVWLDLPTSKFWVNLNPSEPDRIVDSQLGRTDTGRVLLEADLQMKKTVAKLVHPDTPLGAQFWHSIERVGSPTCLSFRQWIVPRPATIREDNGELYILDAPLSVQLESEYIQSRGNSNYQTSCPAQQKSVDQYNETVFRTVILPQVQRAVNEAPEYAELRHVYLSRVAAEWYRQRSVHGSTTFAGLIDSGDITRWVSRQPWSPQDVFHRYVQSYTNGEFNVRRDTRQGNMIETRTYVYGGVDFTDILFHKIDLGDFQSERPDLSKAVKQAFDQPTADQKGKIWLGSVTPPSTASSSQQGSGGHFTMYLLLLAVIGVAVAVWTCSWSRLGLVHQQANPPVRPQATQSPTKPQPTQTRSFDPSNLGLKASAVQAEYRKYHKRKLAQGSQTLSSRKPPAPNQHQHRRDDP